MAYDAQIKTTAALISSSCINANHACMVHDNNPHGSHQLLSRQPCIKPRGCMQLSAATGTAGFVEADKDINDQWPTTHAYICNNNHALASITHTYSLALPSVPVRNAHPITGQGQLSE